MVLSCRFFWEIILAGHYIAFKLSESIGNCFKMILLDQEMNFKKNLIEKYYFFLDKKYVF